MSSSTNRPSGYEIPLPSDDDLDERRTRLLNEKLDVEEEILRIRGQIERAVAERAAGGEYADPNWFARAKSALRHKGREAQEIQLELSDLKAAIAARNRAASWSDRAFIRVARRRLDAALFDELIREAAEEKDGPA